MRDSEFDDFFDGSNHHWLGFNHHWLNDQWLDDPGTFVPDKYPLVDLVQIVADKLGAWELIGSPSADGKEVILQAGRLKPFYAGVRVRKQKGLYYTLAWGSNKCAR